MYIKKVIKRNKNSSKKYEYLHLVENIRTENGPRQRLILNLGKIDIPKEKYKELANYIEAVLTGQQELFSNDPVIEELAVKAAGRIKKNLTADTSINKNEDTGTENAENYIPANLNTVSFSETRTLGAEFVCHEIWKHLGFNKIMLESGIPETVLPIVESLVVGRLISPGSERHTHYWAENLSALYELSTPPPRRSLNSFYRAGDRVFSIKDALEQHLSVKAKELFDLPEKILLMDLTNTYFEGEMLSNSKAKRGHSKEKRTDCKLLTLALIIDEHGFPKYSRLYPGNQSEFKTFKEMIESLIELRPELSQDRTVIIDRGIASNENIEYLKELGIHYIVVSRGKHNYFPSEDMNVIKEDEKRGIKIEVKRHESAEEIHLLCRSTKRIGKESGIRSRQENIFLERLQYIKDGLKSKNRTKVYEKILERIGKLKGKYPKAAKLYDVKVTISKKKNQKQKFLTENIIWTRCQEKYDNAIEREGCYLLKTDLKTFSDKEIWETYTMLTRVESAFKSMKSFLGARPNFHQREDRADTHMFISVLAYHVLHTIEFKLRQKDDYRQWSTIRDVLSSHTMASVTFDVMHENKKKKYHLRTSGIPEPAHKQIYDNLGISPNKIKRHQLII